MLAQQSVCKESIPCQAKRTLIYPNTNPMLLPNRVPLAILHSFFVVASSQYQLHRPPTCCVVQHHAPRPGPALSKLGTAFLPTLFPGTSIRGTPWIVRGSFIKLTSNCAGILLTTALYSPGNFALGVGTAALLQR